MKQYHFILIFLLANYNLFAQFCTSDARFTEIPIFSESQVSSQLNVTYGTAIDWKGKSVPLVLDAYYPAFSEDTLKLRPFVLLVHGGGLITGDKSTYTRVSIEFARRGFVAVTMNYRLGRDCSIDEQSEEMARYRAQQDVNAAMRFIVHNASVLRIDTSWMFIGGGSAGSGTSLAVVYISQSEWNDLAPDLQTELGKLNDSGNKLIETFSFKGVYNDWGATLKQAISSTEMLPMVSFHGDADETVPIDSSFMGACINSNLVYGSRALHNLLIRNNICSDLSVRPGGGHGVYQDTVYGIPFRVGRATCFFKSVFCSNCASNYQTDSVKARCSVITGLTSGSDHEDTAVYPNPFTSKIIIRMKSSDGFYQLMDDLGVMVYQGVDIEQQQFDYLSPGIYHLRIKSGAKWNTMRLIKL